MNDLKKPLEPVPISEFFPPKHPAASSTPDGLQKTRTNDVLVIRARPSYCDVLLMLPPCLFLGCCLSVSADVVFDDVKAEVSIKNWPGYLFCIPFSLSTTMPYSEIANIGMQYTGIKEGSEGNEQPLYDVMLMTRQGKLWRVGSRSHVNEAAVQVEELHYHIFGRNNSEYKRVHGMGNQFPSAGCCNC